MEDRNLEKALDIVVKLMTGEKIGAKRDNISLYEAYNSNMEVYDIVHEVMDKLGLEIYEYEYVLYTCAKEGNKNFGISNEELKERMGLRLNKELGLVFYIMYIIVAEFESGHGTDFLKIEDIIALIDATVSRIIDASLGIVLDENENSIKNVVLMWDELPLSTAQDSLSKASRGSKTGFVKIALNFLVEEGLMVLNEERYYANGRFHAIARGYFTAHSDIIKL